MKKLVVIGNGMAAIRLLEEVTRLAPDLYQITVVGEEPFAGYNRVMLSPLLGGGTDEVTITTHPHQWYRDRGIRLITGSPVVAIRRHRASPTFQDWNLPARWLQLVPTIRAIQ